MSFPVLTTIGENADFVRALSANGVAFIIVGGLAVAFYQCRDPDDVDDLDLMLRPDEPNMRNLISTLLALGHECSWSARDLAKPNVQVPIKNIYYLDILTPPACLAWDELVYSVAPALLNGIPVRVIGRNHLIALKQTAVESAKRVSTKHIEDLRRLEGA